MENELLLWESTTAGWDEMDPKDDVRFTEAVDDNEDPLEKIRLYEEWDPMESF